MKNLTFFSLVFLSLLQFGTTAQAIGLKAPDFQLPQKELGEMEISVEVEIHYLTESNAQNYIGPRRPFPNLSEGSTPQSSPDHSWNNSYPTETMNDEDWNKIQEAITMYLSENYNIELEEEDSLKNQPGNSCPPKKGNRVWKKIKNIPNEVKNTWNGPVEKIIVRVTGKSNKNLFAWTVVHSFFDSVTDAKAHSQGKMVYCKGEDDWHMWKNCRDFSAVMLTLNFGRRIFVEKITLKEATRDLVCIGLIRFVVHNATMKITKGGFPAYNDPYYNQHALTYWGLDGKDHYISTNRWSTPLSDIGALTGFYFLWKWEF